MLLVLHLLDTEVPSLCVFTKLRVILKFIQMCVSLLRAIFLQNGVFRGLFCNLSLLFGGS